VEVALSASVVEVPECIGNSGHLLAREPDCGRCALAFLAGLASVLPELHALMLTSPRGHHPHVEVRVAAVCENDLQGVQADFRDPVFVGVQVPNRERVVAPPRQASLFANRGREHVLEFALRDGVLEVPFIVARTHKRERPIAAHLLQCFNRVHAIAPCEMRRGQPPP